eukprot:2661848-Amphidinium_carterae.1
MFRADVSDLSRAIPVKNRSQTGDARRRVLKGNSVDKGVCLCVCCALQKVKVLNRSSIFEGLQGEAIAHEQLRKWEENDKCSKTRTLCIIHETTMMPCEFNLYILIQVQGPRCSNQSDKWVEVPVISGTCFDAFLWDPLHRTKCIDYPLAVADNPAFDCSLLRRAPQPRVQQGRPTAVSQAAAVTTRPVGPDSIDRERRSLRSSKPDSQRSLFQCGQ